MEDTMAPPSKRRRLADSVQDALQQPETKKLFHGVEHIEAASPSRTADSQAAPYLVEEVHLKIRQNSISSAEDRSRLLRRQGTAVLSDLISTNSNADVVVAVTAEVDAAGSTTALATVAVTADLPDLPSLLSTSTTTSVVSDDSVEPTSSATPSSATPESSVAPSSSDDSSSSGSSSSAEPTTGSSAASSSSDDSSSSNSPSSASASSSNRSTVSASTPTYAVSSSSNSSDNESSGEPEDDDDAADDDADDDESTQLDTTSSTARPSPSSTAASSNNASSPPTAIVDSSTSSNSSVSASTQESSQSPTSDTIVAGTVSDYTAATSTASSSSRLNLTTSASTSTSGSVFFISDFTVNLASATSRTDSRSTDPSPSIDLNALFLATQSDGEVETFTRSDESFTTTLSDGQTATISPSSTVESSSRASSSGSVTTISDDQTTVRSTVFSTATQSSSNEDSSGAPDGAGLAGAVGGGASATSDGTASTSAAAGKGDTDDEVAPPGTIAGGVVGGAAGLALVVLIVLLFLRRYKKRAQIGHQALPPNAAGTPAGAEGGASSGRPGMAERAGLMPFAGAVPALFRHQNRSQNAEPETGERGFQRVGGRKLPSAFSEGMTGPPHHLMSPPPTMPLVSLDDGHERNLSSHSFYRDSAGFYGGDGSTSPNPFSDPNIPAAPGANDAAEQLTMSPGPQRRPTIHAAKSNVQNPSVATSGTPSWTPSSAPAFRSDTPASLEGSRNSRFTEEV